MSLESAFYAVYGRHANPDETNRFNRLAKELGIRDNDAVWSLVFLLGHHLELTDRLPARIELAAQHLLERFKGNMLEQISSAEAELKLTKARIEENLSVVIVSVAQKEITRSAQAVARHTAGKSWLQWLGGAALVGMIILASAFYWGEESGRRVGYAAALDVREAASWAATPTGQAAYRLDLSGDLLHLVRCDQDGWKIERTKSGAKGCFVSQKENGGTVGWLLPIQ